MGFAGALRDIAKLQLYRHQFQTAFQFGRITALWSPVMKRLYRSTRDKKIAGVLGGLGEVLDVDPTLLRLGFVFLAFFTGLLPFLVTYLVAWWLLPLDRDLLRGSQ